MHLHKRKQHFLWRYTLFPLKVDYLFSRRPQLDNLPSPPSKNFLKITSHSLSGVHLQLTPLNQAPPHFSSRPGGHVTS